MLHFIKYELRVHTQTAVHVCLFSFFFLPERARVFPPAALACSLVLFYITVAVRGWNSPFPCSLLSSLAAAQQNPVLQPLLFVKINNGALASCFGKWRAKLAFAFFCTVSSRKLFQLKKH
jgi:hypothetical protein